MSGFVASGSTPGGHINTDPFWPSIDLDALRGTLRIDASVTPADWKPHASPPPSTSTAS
jgi:Phage head completion protein (GPL).